MSKKTSKIVSAAKPTLGKAAPSSKKVRVAREIARRVIADVKPKSIRSRPSRAPRTQNQSAGVALAASQRRGGKFSSGRGMSSSVTVSGRDFVTAIKTGAGEALAGEVLFQQALSPADFTDTRLRVFSTLYDLWQLNSISFHYESAVPTSTAGQLLGFFDRDVDDALTGVGLDNIRVAASSKTERATSVWSHCSWSMSGDKKMTDLYTEGKTVDPHWSTAGVFQLLAATDIVSGTTYGNLYVEYSFTFSAPQLDDTRDGGMRAGSTVTCVDTAPFTSLATVVSSCGVEIESDGKTARFPAGTWLVTWEVTASVVAAYSSWTWTDTTLSPAPTLYDSAQVYNATNEVSSFILTSPTPFSGTMLSAFTTPSVRSFNAAAFPDLTASLTAQMPQLFGASYGKTMISKKLRSLSAASPYKLPASLVKMGVDWVESHLSPGWLKSGTKGFSTLVGWILDSGILGACKDVDQVDPGEIAYWKSLGFLKKKPAAMASAVVEPPLDEYTLVERKQPLAAAAYLRATRK